jgi:hypothetical protein
MLHVLFVAVSKNWPAGASKSPSQLEVTWPLELQRCSVGEQLRGSCCWGSWELITPRWC